MASEETAPTDPEAEISHLKTTFPGQVRVIRDLGDFKYVVNVHPEGLDLTVKFQLSENYPQTLPTVIVKFGHKTEGAEILANQLTQKSRDLKGSQMLEKLVDLALERIEIEGIDVQIPDKPQTKKKSRGKKKSGKSKKKAAESDEDEKKVSMKTAEDVINRIMWDENLPTDVFTVGYMDRFIGMVEKNFSAFSWEDLASVDYTVLAIPKHRIHYFKYKDLTVWDKDQRMDNVFGSTGSNMTITDAIELYEADQRATLIQESPNQNHDSSEEDSDDDSDDGIQVTIGSPTGPAKEVPNSPEEMSKMLHEMRTGGNEEFWEDKLRPNYFLAVRITDPEIIRNVEIVRESILRKQPLYKDCCIPNSSLHITLCVIRLDTDANVANAVHVIQTVRSELARLAPKGKALRLEGVSNFYNRVIYAKVHYPPAFLEMVDHLKLCLWEGGVSNKDGYEFVPHVTIMKVSRPAGRAVGHTKVKPELFAEHTELFFGTQSIDGIHLCAMGDERRADGFYVTPTCIEFTESQAKVDQNEDSTLSDSEETDETPVADIGNRMKQITLADKVRSNYFLTVKISDPNVLRNAELIREHIRKRQPIFQDFCIPDKALHITFGTVLLETDDHVEKAQEALAGSKSELDAILSRIDPLRLEGLGVFFDRIVYAKVIHSPAFSELLSTAVKCLSAAGFMVRQKENYVPHLTLLRVSHQDARVRKLPKVTSSVFAGHQEFALGSQVVEGVHLCPVGRLS